MKVEVDDQGCAVTNSPHRLCGHKATSEELAVAVGLVIVLVAAAALAMVVVVVVVVICSSSSLAFDVVTRCNLAQ